MRSSGKDQGRSGISEIVRKSTDTDYKSTFGRFDIRRIFDLANGALVLRIRKCARNTVERKPRVLRAHVRREVGCALYVLGI